MFYDSIVLLLVKTPNMSDTNALWYGVSKVATGAVFNSNNVIPDAIFRVPPLQVSARIVAINNYLFSDTADIHQKFVVSQLQEGISTIVCLLYISGTWSNFLNGNQSVPKNQVIVAENDISMSPSLSKDVFMCIKGMVDLFTTELWLETGQYPRSPTLVRRPVCVWPT